MRTEDMYYNEQKRSEVMEAARRLRRKFLRYQQAEIVYSLCVGAGLIQQSLRVNAADCRETLGNIHDHR